jgi:glycosyltransferase involved in cell wall biosynthesis
MTDCDREPRALIGLLGRLDRPTDALRDYCLRLSEALGRRGVVFTLREARWERDGWIRTLWSLWKEGRAWQGQWLLVQYTGLMWSRHGFPLAVPLLLGLLKARGCRVAVVFHDVRAGLYKRWIHRRQLDVQYWVMRTAYRLAERSVITIPLDRVPWLPADSRKAVFIPVGANIPSVQDLGLETCTRAATAQKTVAVFGVSSWRVAQQQEVQDVAHAVQIAAKRFPDLRLLVMGRGAEEAAPRLRESLNGCGASLDVRGILPDAEVSRLLASSDVFLFARGSLSTRRGSGLAAIACGVPLVAYQGEETAFPVTEAGVLLVPEGDRDALASALLRVLSDDSLRQSLRERNLRAQQEWFSWEPIANQLIGVLGMGAERRK